MKYLNIKNVTVVITSTLLPSKNNWYGVKPGVEIYPIDRFNQTLDTINSLLNLGFTSIYLIDNSKNPIPSEWIIKIKSLRVLLIHIPADIETKNKGITEIEMLLKFCNSIDVIGPIIKISARYKLADLKLLDYIEYDVVGKIFNRRRGFYEMSTRAYLVKDVETYKKLLHEVRKLTKFLIYRFWSIFLFIRLFNFIKSVINSSDLKAFSDPPISIEEGLYYSIKKLNLNLRSVDSLGISGVAASEGRITVE